MGMPKNLILVRHGESEGNLATALSKSGDESMFTKEFMNRHSSTWRLTEKGKQQSAIAGEWIKKNIRKVFDRYYVSEYSRAKETAAYLNLPNALWMMTYYLREREWGDLDVMPVAERKERFAESLRRKEADPFYWIPTNGESMPALCLRLEKILDTLHRECDMQDVILVVHGEVMWALRYLLERMNHADIIELEHSRDRKNRIHNCQIIQYTRQNPETGDVEPYLNWMRSSCPTNPPFSKNEWRPVVRKVFSNEDLLKDIEMRHSLT